MGAVINDFGEYIPGSRKELYKTRGIGIGDLVDIPLTEYKELIRRDIIWPENDYVKLVESGNYTPEATYIIRTARRLLPASAKFDELATETSVKREAWRYIQFIQEAKGHIMQITKVDMAEAVLKEYYHLVNDQIHRTNPEEAFKNWDTADLGEQDRRGLISLPYNVGYTFIHNLRELATFKEAYATEAYIMGFPYNFDNVWKGVRIRSRAAGYYVILSNGEKVNSEKACATFEEAIELAKSARENGWTPQSKMKKESSVVKVVRPQLEYIERIGPNLRNGHNVTPEIMLKTFGIRGGQFGNWNSQGDRQACLNYAFDAYVDFSLALGMPMQFISLPEGTSVYGDGRKLGVAFGARGIAGASAHYEPGNHVINLTKLHGAGSLAHEMGHAIDKWLKTVALKDYKSMGSAGVTADSWYASVAMHNMMLHSRVVEGKVQNAIDRIVTDMLRSELPISRQSALIDCACNGTYLMKLRLDNILAKAILYNKGRVQPSMPSEQDKIGMAIKLAAGDEVSLDGLDENNKGIITEFAKRIKNGSGNARALIKAGAKLNSFDIRDGYHRVVKIGGQERRGELDFGIWAINELRGYLENLAGMAEVVFELRKLLQEMLDKDDVPGSYKSTIIGILADCNDFYDLHNWSSEEGKALQRALEELDRFTGTTDEEAKKWGGTKCIERKEFNTSARESGESDYFCDAKKLDENRRQPYYSKLQEMFARAFESYVEDKLKQLGLKSQYLVHSTTGSFKALYGAEVFPRDQERQSLFDDFEKLFVAIRDSGLTEGTVFEYGQLYEASTQPNWISYRQNVTVRKQGQKATDVPSRIKTVSEGSLEPVASTTGAEKRKVGSVEGGASEALDTQMKEVQTLIDRAVASVCMIEPLDDSKRIKKMIDNIAKSAAKHGITCGFGDTGRYMLYSLAPLPERNKDGKQKFQVTVRKNLGYSRENASYLIGGIVHVITLWHTGSNGSNDPLLKARVVATDIIRQAYWLPTQLGVSLVNLANALSEGFISSKEEAYTAGKILALPQVKDILLNKNWDN